MDYAQNLWYDHGTGEGGSIIDLVMRLENCDFTQAVQSLGRDEIKPISSVAPALATPTVPALRILSDSLLRHPALLGYLKERGVDPAIANEYCREVRYAVGDKTYFAIGFRNDAGGCELRSERFKGSSTPKNITTIDNGSSTIMVFEGFMDFLSYLSLKGNVHPSCDTAVLNTVVNLPKALPFLERHAVVHTFLDNDEAGRKATAEIVRRCSRSQVVKQAFYRDHKDVNEYLQARIKEQQRHAPAPKTPRQSGPKPRR
ncbi:toprim domain-containing protein [Alistipes sp. i18-0019-D1]